jgi:Tol biopolymer transport system component/tRNA A-37 threonylcarbamoyl transferase component Bud32
VTFPAGSRLGAYEIVSLLGTGGMGEVYRALDSRLNRAVAVKVLRSDSDRDRERRQRFEREARSVAALNHPHICTLYDIGRQDDVDFLVMELLEGETLARRLAAGPLPLEEALRYGIQIAGALEKAHAAGIVHRDIKPANVMLVNRRTAKVLDFGLAKLMETCVDTDDRGIETRTLVTAQAAIVGTPAYMSPEQAEGKRLDARSDVFSFGSMLYEMVTGRRPFERDTPAATISSILRDEATPVGALAGGIPRELERIVSRCLRKDPDRRFQHIGDVRIALEELTEGSVEERSTHDLGIRSPTAAHRARAWNLATIGFLVAASVAGAALWLRRTPPAETPLVLTRLTWDAGLTTTPALSPDGKLVAFASDRSGQDNLDIWVRQVGGGEPLCLTRHEADDHEPAFSPDGTRIAYRSEREGGGIYLISALGGEEQLIARNGRQPRFSPDGRFIAYSEGTPGSWGPGSAKIYVVPASGGSPRQLIPKFGNVREPIWAPDGRSIIFKGRPDTSSAGASNNWDWWVTDLDGELLRKTELTAAVAALGLNEVKHEAWMPDGRLLFSARLGDSRNLWEIPLLTTGETAGRPRRLTAGAGEEELASVAAGGQVAFASVNQAVNVWSVPVEANGARVTGAPQQLTHDAAEANLPSISPDGRTLAFVSTKSGNNDIWIKDLITGRERALAATAANEIWPILSRDGSRIAYAHQRRGPVELFLMSVRDGVPEKVEKVTDAGSRLQDWSPDGRFLLFHSASRRVVEMLEIASGRISQILKPAQFTPFQEHFSPDGRWIVFILRTGPERTQLFVAPFKGEAVIPETEWLAVADGTGANDKPRWSPDGGLLYFTSERDGFRCVWAQHLDPTTRQPSGGPFPVFHAHSARRSLQRVPLSLLEISVARDKLVFNMVERTGNIWLARPQPRP